MSRLERKLDAGDFVVTAEMPTIDGGGFPEIQRQLAPMKAWVDAVNATDNPAAPPPKEALGRPRDPPRHPRPPPPPPPPGRGDRAARVRRRAGHAARLP